MTIIDIPGYSSSTLITLGFTPNIVNRDLHYTKVYHISKRIFIGVIGSNRDYVLNLVGGITRPLDLKIYTKAWDIFYHEIAKARATQTTTPVETDTNLTSSATQPPLNGVTFDVVGDEPEKQPEKQND